MPGYDERLGEVDTELLNAGTDFEVWEFFFDGQKYIFRE